MEHKLIFDIPYHANVIFCICGFNTKSKFKAILHNEGISIINEANKQY